MAIGRGGVLFTLMAFVFVAYIVASQRALELPLTSEQANTQAAKSRVAVLDAYTQTFEQQIVQSFRTSGYFAFKNISKEVGVQSDFLSRSINATFSECVRSNGLRLQSAGPAKVCLPNEYLPNASIKQLTDLAQQEMSITTNYTINNVWLSEEEPMHVTVWVNLSYLVTDPLAQWNRTVIITSDIDMTGVEDPVYEYLRARGYLTASGNRTFQLTRLATGSFNDSNFMMFYGNKSYLAYEGRAPSVLQRYEGKTAETSGCCGIESIIAHPTLNAIPADDRYMNYSMTDHEFASIIQNAIPAYDCYGGEVRAFDTDLSPATGPTIVLEKFRFENTYNLTAISTACAAP